MSAFIYANCFDIELNILCQLFLSQWLKTLNTNKKK